jgi:hypothetical protein
MRPIRFSLCTMLIVVTWTAIALGLWNSHGPHGFCIGLYLAAGSWYAISFTRNPMFRPLSNKRLTIPEILTVFAVCGTLHGLTLPAVQSQCGRRAVPAPLVAPAAAIPVPTLSASAETPPGDRQMSSQEEYLEN